MKSVSMPLNWGTRLKYHLSSKWEGFVKIYSLSSHVRVGKFKLRCHKNSGLGDDVCIMTEMCLGIYFKTVIHTCVHLGLLPLHENTQHHILAHISNRSSI